MSVAELTLSELAEIDEGRLAILFARKLREVVVDIEDRPIDKRPRSITIDIAVIPDPGVDGLLDGAKAQVQIKSKLPSFQTRVYDFGVRDGNLRYSKVDPSNHLVQALPGMDQQPEALDEEVNARSEQEHRDPPADSF